MNLLNLLYIFLFVEKIDLKQTLLKCEYQYYDFHQGLQCSPRGNG
jgi:hypothetical protein